MSLDWVEDVKEFNREVVCRPLPAELVVVRPEDPEIDCQVGLVLEECQELMEALAVGDEAGVADGCVDLVYVTIGLALKLGIDLRPVWDAVHASNMKKKGAPRREDGKIMKGPGWTPPDIAGVLARQSAGRKDEFQAGEANVIDGEVS